MEIAVFTESYEPGMGSKRRQILMAPHDGGVKIWSRMTDGSKGPHNKWEEAFLDQFESIIEAKEQLTRTPVGVYVTSADEKAIADKGYSPVLGTKACNQHAKADPNTDTTAFLDKLYELYDHILIGDDSLETYVIDNRRQAGSTVPLVVPVPTQTMDDAPEITHTSAGKVFNVRLATVPRKQLAERYVHRKIWGQEDFAVFDAARKEGVNVLIYGPTGPGKTSAVEAWAAERDLRLATISGNASMEPSQMTGKFVSDGEGAFMWIDGPVTDVVRNGGVLLLDEVNFINPKIYTNLYALTDGRRSITLLDHHGETIEAHPDLTVFATMNPDYIGTTPLNFAFRNRFDIQIPWDYDDAVEEKLITSKSLRTLMKQLRVEANKGQYETPISTNMGIEFIRFVDILGYEFAAENFIAHFGIDEQASVRMVFQTHEHNLKHDFGIETNIETEQEADKSLDERLAEWAAQIPANV
ncbi:AAA domain containing protein [uncultured Caudovirales phage]|uniref:AAA domain containing protein n=1 Tax=uncultured Caudovirales phage TaxID=2100421 RepID=A0A6J5KIF7_9CAUD|nr:AAA domain containing protein [uncultured Caudovirales phage]